MANPDAGGGALQGDEPTFTDLIYDDAAVPIIREMFPYVQVTDASDCVHENRVQIDLPGSDRRAYIKHAIRNDYAGVSLMIQLASYGEMPGADDLRSILDEMKAERAEEKVNRG